MMEAETISETLQVDATLTQFVSGEHYYNLHPLIH
jgi:hypothetical protein